MASTTTTFPLPLLPTIPDDLGAMDSRKAIRYINTFMKNTLIRGLNNVYDLAEVKDREAVCSFLDYALVVCDMISLHIQGDESFFTTPNPEGVVLAKILGEHSNMNNGDEVYKDLRGLCQKIYAWRENPSTYSAERIRVALKHFVPRMYQKMREQVESMDANTLTKAVTNKALLDMIDGNIQWLAEHSDITKLLPFVLSHHDIKTSSYWPSVSPEGLEMVPMLVRIHAECWKFSPIDPITREVQTRK